LLKQEHELLKAVHSKLGLVYEFYPPEKAGIDVKQVIEMTEA